MKIPAIKVYTHSSNGNLSKLLEKAKQPLVTQDKFEMTRNDLNVNKTTSRSGCGCYGCGGCGCDG